MSMTNFALRGILLSAVASGTLLACGDDADVGDDPMTPMDSGTNGGDPDGGIGLDSGLRDSDVVVGDTGAPAIPSEPVATTCPAAASRPTEIVSGSLIANTEWTCARTYVLAGYVFVKGGATLKIGAGTIVQGDGTSALFITREGKIDAVGEKTNPIVFTSIAAPGTKVFGGWQGLVLLGKATLNVGAVDREFEGLTTNNVDYRYGGADDTHDCGTLKYVRIEFAGQELQPNKELNNLTLAGCGSQTTIDYVQLHMGKDDGIEFFGGTASAKHLVLTGNDDDNIDWDEGWRGNIQFAAVQQHDLTGSGDSNGFEASNRAMAFTATPMSSPRVYNVTLIGDRVATHQVRAMLLKEGTGGEIKNVIAQGFASIGIDVTSKEAADNLRATPPKLSVTNSIFFDIGPGGTTFFPNSEMDNMGDDNFPEDTFFPDPATGNRVGVDPKLAAPYNLTAPGWVPASDSPAATGAATPPSDPFFDAAATYVGAFEPGGEDWTAGWTSYAAN